MANEASGLVDLTARQKLIITGLYLARFDSLGLKRLGFDSFVEAFNVFGYALRSKPASVKNYRDEFDPFFSHRLGWHKRPTREYCLEIYERFKDLELDDFTRLVRSFFGIDEGALSDKPLGGEDSDRESAFAQRLVTGLAAEHYFETMHLRIPEFQGLLLENTTRLGCGYDFRLRKEPHQKDFLAVEVKGLKGQSGSLSMTPKEYHSASTLENRFFLFVVRNFRETPNHTVFQNPIASGLDFKRKETVIVQVSWSATV